MIIISRTMPNVSTENGHPPFDRKNIHKSMRTQKTFRQNKTYKNVCQMHCLHFWPSLSTIDVQFDRLTKHIPISFHYKSLSMSSHIFLFFQSHLRLISQYLTLYPILICDVIKRKVIFAQTVAARTTTNTNMYANSFRNFLNVSKRLVSTDDPEACGGGGS